MTDQHNNLVVLDRRELEKILGHKLPDDDEGAKSVVISRLAATSAGLPSYESCIVDKKETTDPQTANVPPTDPIPLYEFSVDKKDSVEPNPSERKDAVETNTVGVIDRNDPYEPNSSAAGSSSTVGADQKDAVESNSSVAVDQIGSNLSVAADQKDAVESNSSVAAVQKDAVESNSSVAVDQIGSNSSVAADQKDAVESNSSVDAVEKDVIHPKSIDSFDEKEQPLADSFDEKKEEPQLHEQMELAFAKAISSIDQDGSKEKLVRLVIILDGSNRMENWKQCIADQMRVFLRRWQEYLSPNGIRVQFGALIYHSNRFIPGELTDEGYKAPIEQSSEFFKLDLVEDWMQVDKFMRENWILKGTGNVCGDVAGAMRQCLVNFFVSRLDPKGIPVYKFVWLFTRSPAHGTKFDGNISDLVDDPKAFFRKYESKSSEEKEAAKDRLLRRVYDRFPSGPVGGATVDRQIKTFEKQRIAFHLPCLFHHDSPIEQICRNGMESMIATMNSLTAGGDFVQVPRGLRPSLSKSKGKKEKKVVVWNVDDGRDHRGRSSKW
eukprot:TRINITY_DN3426_c0_g1_i2.p2 TRINITY_DN3426_c0_g1~~TRINITY_DN3426_c0_g1_i2.p2  ORF type:complete len:562 (-),score=182.06 TRINITY_DN3426_c0_g1_i2:4509-6158(-)